MLFKLGKVTAIVIPAAMFLMAGAGHDAHAANRSHGKQTLTASYYAKHHRGKRTASGERYDPNALTAAHPGLPLGSLVEVIRPSNGHRVVVRINDRNRDKHCIDLSEAAAAKLGLLAHGRAKVVVQPLPQVAEAR